MPIQISNHRYQLIIGLHELEVFDVCDPPTHVQSATLSFDLGHLNRYRRYVNRFHLKTLSGEEQSVPASSTGQDKRSSTIEMADGLFDQR